MILPLQERPRTTMYESRNDLYRLLLKICSYPTITGSTGEQLFASELETILQALPYFQTHPDALVLHDVGRGRSVVAALVKSPKATKKTVVLIAHYDVVSVDEYGEHAHLAFSPETWTEQIRTGAVRVPQSILEEPGDWLFGRGVMDMKCGLVLNISMLEKACNGDFDGNVLFLALPDEERHSDGMIGAAPLLLEWAKLHNLDYQICIDTEPTFHEDVSGAMVYTGSIGKLLIGAYCVGKETHVGNPFAGLTGTTMVAFLSQAIELNPTLTECVGGEVTPAATCLYARDMKPHYSVQTPYKASAYYNVFQMVRTPTDVLEQIRIEAQGAMDTLGDWLTSRQQAAGDDHENPAKSIRVRMLAEVEEYLSTTQPEVIQMSQVKLLQAIEAGLDTRQATLEYVDNLASACLSLHPLTVIYLAPPFYPSVNSSEHPLVKHVVRVVQQEALSAHGIDVRSCVFFPGLSDLSYTSLSATQQEMAELRANMPLLGHGYDLPLEALAELSLPVLNLGPYGKDAHQWTERLELNYSLEVVPALLTVALHAVFE